MAERARPAIVILDADSTLAGIEGIDWLAERHEGAVALTRDEMRTLGDADVDRVAPSVKTLVRALHGAGIRVRIVSGDIRSARLSLAAHLGIPPRDVYGVDVHFAEDVTSEDFDRASPLWTQRGKPALVSSLALPRPVVAVGDGSTDLMIRTDGAADRFVAHTGFVRRDAVVPGADAQSDSYEALHALLLPRP